MARPVGSKTSYFSKVKQARKALEDQSEQIINEFRQVLRDAAAAQDFKVASEGYQFMILRIRDEEGNSIVDRDVDKGAEETKDSGPTIQIGIALGGIQANQKALPEPVIDITPEVQSDVKQEDPTS